MIGRQYPFPYLLTPISYLAFYTRTATKYMHHCYIPSLWYRAEILSVNGPNATVVFVDFGNEKTLLLENIFEL